MSQQPYLFAVIGAGISAALACGYVYSHLERVHDGENARLRRALDGGGLDVEQIAR